MREITKWITIGGKHIPIFKGESAKTKIRKLYKRNQFKNNKITANDLIFEYKKNELDYDKDLFELAKKNSSVLRDEIKDLEAVITAKDAKDEIEVYGHKVNVNLHKDDVDIKWAIRKYISNSDYMNGLLNGDKGISPDADILKDIENTSSALKKLSPYKGTVYRYDHRQELPKVGETIKIKSFYSTSNNKEELDMVPYYTTRKTIYEIKSKNGKYLGGSRHYTNENEVLFDLGSKFKVTKAEKRGTKNYVVMEEI